MTVHLLCVGMMESRRHRLPWTRKELEVVVSCLIPLLGTELQYTLQVQQVLLTGKSPLQYRGSKTFFWPPWALHSCKRPSPHPHTLINKSKVKFQKKLCKLSRDHQCECYERLYSVTHSTFHHKYQAGKLFEHFRFGITQSKSLLFICYFWC
jgi:hypothetical protein